MQRYTCRPLDQPARLPVACYCMLLPVCLLLPACLPACYCLPACCPQANNTLIQPWLTCRPLDPPASALPAYLLTCLPQANNALILPTAGFGVDLTLVGVKLRPGTMPPAGAVNWCVQAVVGCCRA